MRCRIALKFLDADVYNKIDAISLEQMDKLAREDHTVVISCELGLKYVVLLLFAWKSKLI